VWLYKKKQQAAGNSSTGAAFDPAAASAVFLNFSSFYPVKGGTCKPGSARVTWNGCYGVDSKQQPVLFDDTTPPWDPRGGHVGAIRVVGAQAVVVGYSCFGRATSAPITAANGTVSLAGPLNFETLMPEQWVERCCIPYHELGPTGPGGVLNLAQHLRAFQN
jgi:hypothetical protein